MRSVNPPNKPLKLPPFAMWPAFPTADYYEGSGTGAAVIVDGKLVVQHNVGCGA